MNELSLPIYAALLVGFLVTIGLAFYTILQRSARGALSLWIMLISLAIWNLCYLFELAAFSIEEKLFWYGVKSILTAILPPALLLFSLDFTHKPHWKKWWLGLLLLFEPVFALILYWTNDLHRLFFNSSVVKEIFPNIRSLIFEFSSGYYFHLIYSYLLIVIAIVVILIQYIRAPRLVRRQSGIVLIGMLIPIILGLLTMGYPNIFRQLEIIPFSLSLCMPLIAIGVFRYRISDSMPIARDQILDTIKDAVVLLDIDLRILDVNQAAKKILGSRGKIPVGKSLPSISPVLGRLVVDKEKKHSFRTEVVLENGDGNRIYEVRCSPINTESGQVTGQLLLLDDITDRNEAQKRLRESENRFRNVVELLPDGLTIHCDGKIVYANEAFSRMVGTANPEQLIGRDVLEFVHPEMREIVHERIKNTYSGKIEAPMVEELLRIDGRIVFTEVVSVPSNYRGKTFAHVIHRDLTERMRAEQDQLLQISALNAAANAIVITDRTGKVIWINPAFTDLTGFSNQEIIGTNLRILKSGQHDIGFYQNLWETILSGKVWRDQIINRRKNGDLYVEDMTITPVINSNGNITHFVAIKMDVTDRNQAEEALRASEMLYRTTIDAIDDMIYVIDADYRFSLYNSTFSEWLKENDIVQGSVLGKQLPEVFPFFTDDHFKEYRQVYESGNTLVTQEITEVANTQIVTETRKSLVQEAGKPPRFVTVVRDITEANRRQREREAVIKVAAAMRELNQRSELLKVLLEQLVELLATDASTILLWNPATDRLEIELGSGSWENLTDIQSHISFDLSREVLQKGELYINNDAFAYPEDIRIDLPNGVKAVAGAPLITSRQTIGVLWLGRNREWNESELRILTAIADMAANAIQRTTLYQQTQHRLEQLQALQTVDQAITSSLDLRIILDILLEKVTDQLHVDAADILLYDPETQMLRFAARRGFKNQSTQRTFIRLGEGIAGQVVVKNEIISCPDIRNMGTQEISFRLMASEGFVAYYGVPLTARGQVQGVLQIFHRSPFEAEPEWLDFLQALSGQAAVAIDNAMLFDGMSKANIDLRKAYEETIEGWALALEYRDQETEGHSRRVVGLTVQLAERLGIVGESLLDIRRGAILHDVGKMGIPDNILQKPGPLTDNERELMRQHPLYAYKMLSSIDFLVSSLDIPYCHHENWDGSGYPMGLKGEEIPLAARIFAIVDVWDALNFDRPYRKAWEKEKVVEYIRSQSGNQFDPHVVNEFFNMLDEIGWEKSASKNQ